VKRRQRWTTFRVGRARETEREEGEVESREPPQLALKEHRSSLHRVFELVAPSQSRTFDGQLSHRPFFPFPPHLFLPPLHVLARRSRDGYDRRYHTLLHSHFAHQ
jgi:hypothetical protein